MKDIKDMQVPELENTLQRGILTAEAAGKVWADARADYDQFDDKKKVVLAATAADVEREHQESGATGKLTQSAKEEAALRSDTYESFITLLDDRRRKFYHAQVAWDMARLKVEAIRTILSTRREEIKRLGS